MFRLSKGNQSRKNHKIIHQTTKVSETDAPLSTPALNAAQHEAEQARLAKEAAEKEAQVAATLLEKTQLEEKSETIVEKCDTVTEKIIIEHVNHQNQHSNNAVPPPVQPVADMESYIVKMREYMIYMKELEERNARLEFENSRYRAENAQLKGQLNTTPPPSPIIKMKDFPITEQIRVNHMMN